MYYNNNIFAFKVATISSDRHFIDTDESPVSRRPRYEIAGMKKRGSRLGRSRA